jgi:hypothetical protein
VAALWVLVAVGASELIVRSCEIVRPSFYGRLAQHLIYGGVFVLAGSFSVAGGLDLFDSLPRELNPDVAIAATAALAAFLAIPVHSSVGLILKRLISTNAARRLCDAALRRPVTDRDHLTIEHPARDVFQVRFQRDLDSFEKLTADLQLALQARGFLERGYRRGSYCDETEAAVAAYQAYYGLVVDGLIGPIIIGHAIEAEAKAKAETEEGAATAALLKEKAYLEALKQVRDLRAQLGIDECD